MHFSLPSYYRQKAVANSSSAMVCVTPSHMLLRLSWVRRRPASYSFTFWNNKKSAGAKLGE